MESPNLGVVISLCDKTGHMVEPWMEGGYKAVLVDPQHPRGVRTEGRITRVGATILDAIDHIGAIVRAAELSPFLGFRRVRMSPSAAHDGSRKKEEGSTLSGEGGACR